MTQVAVSTEAGRYVGLGVYDPAHNQISFERLPKLRLLPNTTLRITPTTSGIVIPDRLVITGVVCGTCYITEEKNRN